jgi:hypothetical protein
MRVARLARANAGCRNCRQEFLTTRSKRMVIIFLHGEQFIWDRTPQAGVPAAEELATCAAEISQPS